MGTKTPNSSIKKQVKEEGKILLTVLRTPVALFILIKRRLKLFSPLISRIYSPPNKLLILRILFRWLATELTRICMIISPRTLLLRRYLMSLKT
jgi:hypothetical protein